MMWDAFCDTPLSPNSRREKNEATAAVYTRRDSL